MFDQRAIREKERMDLPDFNRDLAERSFRFIHFVNRFLGGTRIVRSYLKRERQRLRLVRPLRILDIGAGDCDIPITIAREHHGPGTPPHFYCVERCPYATAIARRNIAAQTLENVTVVNKDIFEHTPEGRYDVGIASMVMHHLDDEEIRELLRRLRGLVRYSVLVNDLRRSGACYLGGRMLTLLAKADVQHDVLLSIRKGFTRKELTALMSAADAKLMTINHRLFGRVTAELRFE